MILLANTTVSYGWSLLCFTIPALLFSGRQQP